MDHATFLVANKYCLSGAIRLPPVVVPQRKNMQDAQLNSLLSHGCIYNMGDFDMMVGAYQGCAKARTNLLIVYTTLANYHFRMSVVGWFLLATLYGSCRSVLPWHLHCSCAFFC